VAGCIRACQRALQELRAPWACVHVWGAADAPARWGDSVRSGEGEAGAGCESQYAVLVLPGGGLCMFRALSSSDAG
jgi:hypothetical protein